MAPGNPFLPYFEHGLGLEVTLYVTHTSLCFSYHHSWQRVLTVSHFCKHHQPGVEKTSPGGYTHGHNPIRVIREPTTASAEAAGDVPGWRRSAR